MPSLSLNTSQNDIEHGCEDPSQSLSLLHPRPH
jgi:hypothetical protein